MENNTPMSIMNAEMESLMADYNEVMIEFAEASMIEDNYTEKYEKRDECRIVKAQIDLLKKLMNLIINNYQNNFIIFSVPI